MKRLGSDERGAIMVMGVAAGLFLIGALWFLMGIADTLVWRDKMQEAVDAAAFSSATVHARGMNFIAALNLVMLALVTIHMVLGLVADGLTVVGVACLVPPLTPAAPPVFSAAQGVRRAQTVYDAFMWPALQAMNASQTAAAVGIPHLGTLAGREVAGDYKASVVTLGASNVPMIPAKGQGKTAEASDGLGGLGGARLGLPVAFEPYSDMCKRPVSWVLDWVAATFRGMAFVQRTLEWVRAIPLVGEKLAAGVEKLIDSTFSGVSAVIGEGLVTLECSSGGGEGKLSKSLAAIRRKLTLFPLGARPDARWGQPGAKKIWGAAENGSQWMQVWASTVGASKTDDEERKVAIARRKFGDVKKTTVTGRFVAQAEFFYDCGSSSAEWSSISCNGSLGETQFTMYNMKWKARLRRFREASFSQFLFDSAVAGIDGLGGFDKVIAKIPGADKKLGGIIDVGGLIRGVLDDYVTNPIRDALGSSPNDDILH